MPFLLHVDLAHLAILPCWVSAALAGAFCVVLVSWITWAALPQVFKAPILSCYVGLCNLCVVTHTHMLIHMEVVLIIYWSLIAEWKGKKDSKV